MKAEDKRNLETNPKINECHNHQFVCKADSTLGIKLSSFHC